MKAIYGPVPSWRLGKSLGVDPVCSESKICSFNCVYCQLGKGVMTVERKEYVSLDKLKQDFRKVEADTITFSGTGEPTLATNLNEMVDFLRSESDKKIAILTNSCFLGEEDVREALNKMDIVVAKLDASNEEVFRKMNQPHESIRFDSYLEGIKDFREQFKGKFALQMMFVDINKDYADEMANLAREINPDEVEINTPLRHCAVKPLSEKELGEIEEKFKGLNAKTVYEAEKPRVEPIDVGEMHKRRP